MGQWLCVPMVLLGAGLIYFATAFQKPHK